MVETTSLPAPKGLLLDFGGVIVEAPRQPSVPLELVGQLVDLVDGTVSREQVTRDLADGVHAYAEWCDRVGDEAHPVEPCPDGVWSDFISVRWPEPAREAVRREAARLSYAWTLRHDWTVRPGIPRLLALARGAALPVAIVSNTLCGAAHRDFLADIGLADEFAVQVYSDEACVRKPNPELIHNAIRQVEVSADVCWSVGDSLRRDILCARRAGVGVAVLMRSFRTDREPAEPEIVPDVVVEDGHGLCEVLSPLLCA